jgi:hypothetical protein
MKINSLRISAGVEWRFLTPVNFFEYSNAQLRLKAGNRFMVPPEPKAARDLPVARPSFNPSVEHKNTLRSNSSRRKNTILPQLGKS